MRHTTCAVVSLIVTVWPSEWSEETRLPSFFDLVLMIANPKPKSSRRRILPRQVVFTLQTVSDSANVMVVDGRVHHSEYSVK